MTRRCPRCNCLNEDDAASCYECGIDLSRVKMRQNESSTSGEDDVYVLWDFPPFAFFRTVSQTRAQFRFTAAATMVVCTLACLAIGTSFPVFALLLWSILALIVWVGWRVGTLNAQIVRERMRGSSPPPGKG